MSYIKLSDTAKLDIKRFHEFYEPIDFNVADDAIETIYDAFDMLEAWPLSGTPIQNIEELRKLVIPFGDTGYTAFYRYVPSSDTCVIAQIFHQKEQYTNEDLESL
jgi:plasmid stabilization system protein ParE